ncbi:MAG: DUF2183 domain-containing protein, partial [Saprospiraceae bacterium]|nr:DUF2183 domain-containing protein [Saprospiraceae bacterium]
MKYFKLHRDKVIIQPYRGFSSPLNFYLRGRILEDKNIAIHRDATLFDTIKSNFNRWESDEIPHVPVTLQVADTQYETTTDREGYFIFEFSPGLNQQELEEWQFVDLVSKFQYWGQNYQISAHAEIFLPSTRAKLGIITDIDDTILQTDVLFRLKLLRNTFGQNSFQRRQLSGVSQWINALHRGVNEDEQNPVFYVSKSPRNIFDYLANFLTINDFPKGPVLLRDFGRQGIKRSKDYLGHKEDEIDRILNTYPDLKFIFFGDIAGRDPQIYHYIEQKYPGRVLAIFIRDIDHKRRRSAFEAWYSAAQPSKLTLIRSTLEGAKDTYAKGWHGKGVLEKLDEE